MVCAWAEPPTWKISWALGLSSGTVKVCSTRWRVPVAVASTAAYVVYGALPSCNTALTAAPGVAETAKPRVYSAPAISGTPSWPMPASHGLASPPATVVQSWPSVTASAPVPKENQGLTPALKSPLSICSGASGGGSA